MKQVYVQDYGPGGGLHYEAEIQTPSGTYNDHGTVASTVIGVSTFLYGSVGQEAGFLSDLQEPELALPTSKEQCAGSGFEQFGIFKNQGECVSFVATEGKNEPGKNVAMGG